MKEKINSDRSEKERKKKKRATDGQASGRWHPRARMTPTLTHGKHSGRSGQAKQHLLTTTLHLSVRSFHQTTGVMIVSRTIHRTNWLTQYVFSGVFWVEFLRADTNSDMHRSCSFVFFRTSFKFFISESYSVLSILDMAEKILKQRVTKTHITVSR